MRWRVLVLILAGAAGCGGPRSPVEVAILGESGVDGQYTLKAAELTTLTSLDHLQGGAADLRGNGSIVIDPQELQDAANQGHLNTVSDYRHLLIKDGGALPSLDFATGTLDGKPDVYLASDFSSLAMVTVYHHLEQARKMALHFGMPDGCLSSMTTYYDVSFVQVQNGDRTPQKDNAAFFPILESFLVLPFARYQTVPLGMNPGVMAHEYHHGVWNCLVEEDKPVSGVEFLLDPTGQHFFRSLNEGLADFFGAETTSDPDFLRKSIPSDGDQRDLRIVRQYSAQMDDAARTTGGLYDPYPMGSVLAAALWTIRTRTGDIDGVGRTVMHSLSLLRTRAIALGTEGVTFTAMDYLEELVAAFGDVAPSDQSQACSVLQGRFGFLGHIRGCP